MIALIKDQNRFAMITAILVTVISFSFFIYAFHIQKQLYIQGIDGKLNIAAHAAGLYLGKDFVDRYDRNHPISEASYLEDLEGLSHFARENNVEYVYVMVKEGNDVYTVISSATPEEIRTKTYDTFYTKYNPSQSVLKGFEERKSFYVEESDDYGTFRSYCEYKRSPSGKIYMIGADIRTEVVSAVLSHLFRSYTLFMGMWLLFIFILFYIYFVLIRKNSSLAQISATDNLTGLFNRRKIDNILIEEHAKVAEKNDYHCSCLLVDVDYFKSINDRLGHLVGDNVLKELSELMKHSFRSSDFLGRWGGEEFLVILPLTSIENAWDVAENLCRKIENYFLNSQTPVTVSIGVGLLSADKSIRQSFVEIDNALYEAKESGRNQVRIAHQTNGAIAIE